VLNAEIAAGTIQSILDAVGYMTWTFFARRAKANPTYYGIASNKEEDVEQGLLKVVQEAVTKLRENGCLKSEKDNEDATIPTSLGIAAGSFYLDHRTPRKMQMGIKEVRKIILSLLEKEKDTFQMPQNGGAPFVRSQRIDEVSVAWIIYVLCSTHELDELPVRHNEELLNEELSDTLTWGPDTASVLAGNAKQDHYHDPSIYEDPHTKAFLLVQAHLQRAKLPISDYVNDTKSVMDNLPRLLAALQFITGHENTAAGTLEVLTQCIRTRQYLETRSMMDQDPLEVHLPGCNAALVRRIRGTQHKTLYEVRKLPRQEATSMFQKISSGRDRLQVNVSETINALYALPLVTVAKAVIAMETIKTTGKIIGKLRLDMQVDRSANNSSKESEPNPLTLTILVGSFQQHFLLAQSSLSVTRSGQWSRELSLDWPAANADGGPDGGYVWVRLLWDGVRGLDWEQRVPLK